MRVAAALEQWAAEHNDQLSPETLGEVGTIAETIRTSAYADLQINDLGDNVADRLGELFSPARAERANTLVGVVAGWMKKRPASPSSSDPNGQPESVEDATFDDDHDNDGEDGQALDGAADDSSFEADTTFATDTVALGTRGTDEDLPVAHFAQPAVSPAPALPPPDLADDWVEAPAFLRSDKIDEEDDVRLYGPKRPWKPIAGTFFALLLLGAIGFGGWYWYTQRNDAVEATTTPPDIATATVDADTEPATSQPTAAPTAASTLPPEPTPEVPTFWAETTPILNSGTAQIAASTYAVSPANRAVLTGHTAAITGVVVSDDGRVLTSGADRRLVDWGADVTLADPDVLNVPSPLTVLERTLDQRIIAGDTAGNVSIIDLVDVSEPVVVAVHTVAISAAAELTDGRLAIASVDGDVDVFALDSPTDRVILPHDVEVTSVAALPDGSIATAAVDGVIRLWPANGADTPGQIATLGAPVTAMIVLADGRIAAASVDGDIHVVLAEDGASDPLVLPGHIGAIRSLFQITLPDGTSALASGGDDTTIRLWDLTTKTQLRVLEGHGDIISGIDVLPDGRLVSTSGDGTGRVWDLTVPPSRPVIAPHDWNLSAIHAWDNDLFVTGGIDGKVVVASTSELSEPRLLTQHDAPVVGVASLQTGDVVSLDASSVLRVSQPTGDASGPVEFNVGPGATSLDVRESLGVVTGHADGSVRFHDFAEEVGSIDAHGSGVNDVVALVSGLVASAGQDMTVRILDFDNPDQIPVFDLHTAPVDVVIELPDGRIASAGSDGIYIYTVEGLAQDHIRLNGQRSRTISLVALSNDRLISTGDDGRVRLWDLTSPESEPTTLVDIPGIVNPHLIQAGNGLFVAGAARGYVVFTLP